MTCAAVSHIEPSDTSGPAPTCSSDDKDFKFGGKTCSVLSKKTDAFAIMCSHLPSVMESCCSSCRDAQGWGGSCSNNPSYLVAGHYDCDDVAIHVDEEELADFCQDDDFSENCCASCSEVEHIDPTPQTPAHKCLDSELFSFDGKKCDALAKTDEIHLLCEKVEDVGEYCCATCRDAVSDAQYCDGDDEDFRVAGEYSCEDLKSGVSSQELRDLCQDHEISENCCAICEGVNHIEPSENTVVVPTKDEECSGEVDGKSCDVLVDESGHFSTMCKHVQAVADGCCSQCTEAFETEEKCSEDNKDYRVAEHYSCEDIRKNVCEEELADFCSDRDFANNCCGTCNTVSDVAPPEKESPFEHDSCRDTEGYTFGKGHTCEELTEGDAVFCDNVPEVSENCCASCRDADEYVEGCSGDDPTFRLAEHYSCEEVDANTDNEELSGLCEANPQMKSSCCKTCGSVQGINQNPPPDYSELGTCKDNDDFTFGTKSCSEIAHTEEMTDLCTHIDDVARECCATCSDVSPEEPGDFCTVNPDFKLEDRTCQQIMDLNDKLMATFCKGDPDVAENCCALCASVNAIGTNFNEDVEPTDVVVDGIDDSDMGGRVDSKVASGTVDSCGSGEIHFALELMTDKFPKDTTWTLFDYEETIERLSPEYTEKEKLNKYSVCLESDKHYVFEIRDGSWDGICCGQNGDGYYTIMVDGHTVNTGGEFTRSSQVLITPPCKKSSEVRIVMDLTTDFFGSETSFRLSNHGRSGSFDDDLGAFERRIMSTCVSKGCYDLTVKDEGNNGLCCEYGRGGYTVVYDDEVFADSAFEKGASETTTFGEDCPAGSEGMTVDEGEPVKDGEELESAHAYLDFLAEHEDAEKTKAESP